jgi:type III restriction enzyme
MATTIDQTLRLAAQLPKDEQLELLRRLTKLVNPPNNLIVKTPGVVGGRARVDNTRLAVWLLINWIQMGWTDEDLLEGYPSLTPESIAAVKAYYAANQKEIDREIAENDAA